MQRKPTLGIVNGRRVRAFWFAIGIWLSPSLVAADTLSIGGGYGDIFSQDAAAVFLRYQKEAPKLSGRDSFYELSLGSWNGSNHNEAIAIARGMRWPWSRNNYFSAELGVGAVSQVTDHLGTQGQFLIHLALGHRFGKYDLSIGQAHYSNGKKVFHWHGPNTGENFTTFELGREF